MLDYGSKIILEQLNLNGFKAYIVGGSVRNYLLRKKIEDYDIATDALPSEVEKIFSKFNVILIGIKHGTVTIIIKNKSYEVTTFRNDGEYLNNRKPIKVEYIDDLYEDLKRRDFTINAIAYSESEGFIDPFEGIKDLDSKTIRAIGNPDKRFSEDALRILRAIRFSSVFGFCIETETKKSIYKNKDLLNNISSERKVSELRKILLGKYVKEVLLNYSDIFFILIPELKLTYNFLQHSKYHIYDVYTHTVNSICYAKKDYIIRLSLLLHDIAKPISFNLDNRGDGHFKNHANIGAEIALLIMTRLKIDNKTKNIVYLLIKLHDETISPNKQSIKVFLKEYTKELFFQLLEVKFADAKAHTKKYALLRIEQINIIKSLAEEIIINDECYSLDKLKINGNDLMFLGYKDKHIKDELNKLLSEVIEDNTKNNKNLLMNKAKKDYDRKFKR